MNYFGIFFTLIFIIPFIDCQLSCKLKRNSSSETNFTTTDVKLECIHDFCNRTIVAVDLIFIDLIFIDGINNLQVGEVCKKYPPHNIISCILRCTEISSKTLFSYTKKWKDPSMFINGIFISGNINLSSRLRLSNLNYSIEKAVQDCQSITQKDTETNKTSIKINLRLDLFAIRVDLFFTNCITLEEAILHYGDGVQTSLEVVGDFDHWTLLTKQLISPTIGENETITIVFSVKGSKLDSIQILSATVNQYAVCGLGRRSSKFDDLVTDTASLQETSNLTIKIACAILAFLILLVFYAVIGLLVITYIMTQKINSSHSKQETEQTNNHYTHNNIMETSLDDDNNYDN